MDHQLQFVIHPQRNPARGIGRFNEAKGFSGGLARVHIGGVFRAYSRISGWRDGAWYYINRKGEIVRRYCLDDEGRP